MESSIDQIMKTISNRLEQLIQEDRYEDAIAIGEEFDEWIKNLVS
jgi:hypothetical protein